MCTHRKNFFVIKTPSRCDDTPRVDTMDEQFSKFLDGVSDAFFVKYYDSTPCGFRWAVLDFEAHTRDTVSHRFHYYRLFGEDPELHEKLVQRFDERRKNVMLYK